MPNLHQLCKECPRTPFLRNREELHVYLRRERLQLPDLPCHTWIWYEIPEVLPPGFRNGPAVREHSLGNLTEPVTQPLSETHTELDRSPTLVATQPEYCHFFHPVCWPGTFIVHKRCAPPYFWADYGLHGLWGFQTGHWWRIPAGNPAVPGGADQKLCRVFVIRKKFQWKIYRDKKIKIFYERFPG